MMELFERRAEVDALRRAIWERQKEGPWAEALADLAWVLEAELGWLEGEERGSVRNAAGTAIQELLTSWRPEKLRAGKVVLDAFAEWMATLEEWKLLDVCWELLAFERRHGFDFDEVTTPVYSVRRRGRLTGALELESLELALALADEAENLYWWRDARWALAAWERDSMPYFQALQHESYVVRGWAAKAIGLLHGKLSKAPSKELLDRFGRLEVSSPGVTGGFMHGAGWGFSDSPLSEVEESFVRPWFLGVLRSGGKEPVVPQVQSLEFYAHEYFCRDADAIREMLRMGRTALAIETATEDVSARGVLDEVLKEMAASDDEDVARAIRRYLE